jgi:hypothetical protein
MISAYEHGQNAARHGKHIQACPFDPGTLQWREWCDGFMAYRPWYGEDLRNGLPVSSVARGRISVLCARAWVGENGAEILS